MSRVRQLRHKDEVKDTWRKVISMLKNYLDNK